jgi:hypothetical protein
MPFFKANDGAQLKYEDSAEGKAEEKCKPLLVLVSSHFYPFRKTLVHGFRSLLFEFQ